jgi:urea transport system ATP-binding protein
VIAHLAAGGEMAILLVEQYFDFARELAHRIAVMDRGEIVIDDAADRLNPEVVKRHIAV